MAPHAYLLKFLLYKISSFLINPQIAVSSYTYLKIPSEYQKLICYKITSLTRTYLDTTYPILYYPIMYHNTLNYTSVLKKDYQHLITYITNQTLILDTSSYFTSRLGTE